MSELTRQERFSMSRQFAKELVADSIITDAAAQFLALMIEEVHNTKIAPLQAELNRRADLPPTLSTAMELPEVKAMKAALELARNRLQRLAIEFPTESEGRYEVNEWAEEAAAARAAIKETKA